MFFFFQAEDGIRDLVRSRGLGDVYKRQDYDRAIATLEGVKNPTPKLKETYQQVTYLRGLQPVSYTHLTLPTSDLV